MLTKETVFDWTVIGAGPAGIAAIGKLLDNHVDPKRIAWLDPKFTVGDFGTKWRTVPSNTKVHLFLKYLYACPSFHYAESTKKFPLHNFNPQETCELKYMADPLQWVTNQVRKQVYSHQAWVEKISLDNHHWTVEFNKTKMASNNIILAIGAEPKTLDLANTGNIPLDIAMDKDKLEKICNTTDTIAVYGSSHSAILIIKHLLETCGVHKVINFYQSPLRYAVELEDEILFDDTGLKGTTADWARKNIDRKLPKNLTRIHSSHKTADDQLLTCTKVIHAVGFQRRTLLVENFPELTYDDKNGIIAPGLFGVGIAFPEAKANRFGTIEHRVGLWKFMEYLTRIMPIWLSHHI